MNPKRVVVRRSVYAAAQELQKESEAVSYKAYNLAEKKTADCKAAGDKAGAKFWHDAYNYLLSVEMLDGEATLVED
jgi:hypothetical protein